MGNELSSLLQRNKMVLYKLPWSRKATLLAASGADKLTSYFKQVTRWSLEEPHVQPLFKFDSSKLKQWTLVTDTMFGGSSTCKLGYTKNNSCTLVLNIL